MLNESLVLFRPSERRLLEGTYLTTWRKELHELAQVIVSAQGANRQAVFCSCSTSRARLELLNCYFKLVVLHSMSCTTVTYTIGFKTNVMFEKAS